MTAALRRHLRQFQKLPVFAGTRLEAGRVRLIVQIRDQGLPVYGEALELNDDDTEVTVYLTPGVTPSAASATLLHELVHASGLWGHDRRFRDRLIVAMTQAFPEVPVPARVRRRLARLPMILLDEVTTVVSTYAAWRRGEASGFTLASEAVIAGIVTGSVVRSSWV